MAAIQQWWLGLNRKREIVVIPGVQFLVNWFLGSGDLEATLQDGTLDNDYGTWVVDEGNYLDPEPGYSTYTSTNTSPDEMVLTNTGGSKIVMEVMFNVDGSFGVNDRPVQFDAQCDTGYVSMIGAEGTGSAMPGQIVFSCGQQSGGGDGPHWTPTPGQDYSVILEWNADEGPSGTARWFVDGVEWGLSGSIGEVGVMDASVLQTVTYTANHGHTYYANLYSTPGPGFNALNWIADTDGNIGGTPDPTSIDYSDFGHNGSHYGVTVTNGFGDAQTNYAYSLRAGFPSEGVEFRLNGAAFVSSLWHRSGLIHHDGDGDGWAFDIGIDGFGSTEDRILQVVKWDGGSGLGVASYSFTAGTESKDFRAHIGNNELRIWIDDVLVDYGPHLTAEVNFSTAVRDVIFNAARFAGSELATVASAGVRDLAFPNPSTVVSADFNLSAGYEAAYTAEDASWTPWASGVAVTDQGDDWRTKTSDDISFDGIGFITLCPEASLGLMYSGSMDSGLDPTQVMEFRIRHIAEDQKVAVGSYAPGVGPPPNFNDFLAGFNSGCAYYDSTGHIDGYGGVNAGDYDPYGPGDIISVMILNGSQVQFFKNGVAVGLPVSQINSTVSIMVSVGNL